ncbi:MAG: hypothetical protein A2Y53_07610 [Chloroflexi bacterium RBG_16_47_49]|nr:MAG: hypothetical protein A2Y53_07610 [Chloroflexi bacterium RBG_16_47_49]
MTYTQKMYDALKRLGKQRQEEGRPPSQYDDLIGEIDRLNAKIDELEDQSEGLGEALDAISVVNND